MMKLTAKGRYAVNAILEMAMNKEQRPLSIAEISRHQNISQSYLEQLFAKLGLVVATQKKTTLRVPQYCLLNRIASGWRRSHIN